METESVIKLLSAAITPTILISALGLILLSMVNRFARPIDRIYQLVARYKEAPESEREGLRNQISILEMRSQLLQKSILCVITSIFLIGMMIMMIFMLLEFHWPLLTAIKMCFVLCLIFSIVGLGIFLHDIRLALQCTKIAINNLPK